MTNHWIVTNALHDVGALSQEERCHQTVLTLNSIRIQDPHSRIYLVVGSPQELTGIWKRTLIQLVDVYVDVWHLPEFQQIYHATHANRQWNKSNLEAFLIWHVLKNYVHAFVKPTHRIFKISGRYLLNKDFDVQTHVQANQSWCMQTPQPGIWDHMQQVSTRLYSVCGSLINEYEQVILDVGQLLHTQHSAGTWLDIEHALYELTKDKQVQYLPVLGVHGQLGYTGDWVRD